MQRNRTRELKKWLIGQRQMTLDEKSKASQSLTSSHDAPLIPGHRAASNLFPAPWNILAAQGDLRSLKCCPKPATANDPCQWRPTADPALMFTFTVSSVSFNNPPCIKPPESYGERALGNMQHVAGNKLVRLLG